MQIIARSNLLAFLASEFMDPDGLLGELQPIGQAVLDDTPGSIQWFLYGDCENGDDPVISYDDPTIRKVLYSEDSENGYYGVDHIGPNATFATGTELGYYSCYLGGSPWQSAGGFTLTPVVAVYPE